MGQHKPATEGWVYFLRAEGVPVIKIGFSTEPETRVSDLMTGSPVPLTIIKQVRASYKMEQTLLALFEEYRSHGEWFHAVPALIGFIDRLAHKEKFCLVKLFVDACSSA